MPPQLPTLASRSLETAKPLVHLRSIHSRSLLRRGVTTPKSSFELWTYFGTAGRILNRHNGPSAAVGGGGGFKTSKQDPPFNSSRVLISHRFSLQLFFVEQIRGKYERRARRSFTSSRSWSRSMESTSTLLVNLQRFVEQIHGFVSLSKVLISSQFTIFNRSRSGLISDRVFVEFKVVNKVRNRRRMDKEKAHVNVAIIGYVNSGIDKHVIETFEKEYGDKPVNNLSSANLDCANDESKFESRGGVLLFHENNQVKVQAKSEDEILNVKPQWKVNSMPSNFQQRKIHVINGKVTLECPVIVKQFAAEEISTQVLRKLVDDASKFLNDIVTKAVVTVRVNDSQRIATKDAGRIAGLEVLRVINETTDASLAYGFEKKNNETILVFDLGGGTFDVSVLEVGDGVFEVLYTPGDIHLGDDVNVKRGFEDYMVSGVELTYRKLCSKIVVEFNDCSKQVLEMESQFLSPDCFIEDLAALLRFVQIQEKQKLELAATTQQELFAMGRLLIPLTSYFLLLHLDMLGLSLELGSFVAAGSNPFDVIRASDVFFWPRDPAPHTIHIASVAYNTIFLGSSF
nr:stromal 70 kDa heat shock-related protein, chloroplastic-like [Ipomoea batatas]GMD29363.1 stromal 70 kDa heat shock-related protein, chloroplastic-like [Ipomoea batatas]